MEIGHSILFNKTEIPQLGGKGDEEHRKYVTPTYILDDSDSESTKRVLALNILKTKPCPFCGEQPYTMISQINDSFCNSDPPRLQAKIACKTCDVSKYRSIVFADGNFLNILSLMIKVTEDWNTRK